MSTRPSMVLGLAVGVATTLAAGCRGAPPAGEPRTSATSTETTSSTSSNGAAATAGGEPTATPPATGAATGANAPLSSVPECDGYLRLYQRCEPTLAPSIAAGDRRDFVHEAAWLEYMAGTPEVAGMPDACRDMTRELQAVCP